MAREALDAVKAGDLERARLRAQSIARSMGDDLRAAAGAAQRGLGSAAHNRMIGRAPVNRGER